MLNLDTNHWLTYMNYDDYINLKVEPHDTQYAHFKPRSDIILRSCCSTTYRWHKYIQITLFRYIFLSATENCILPNIIPFHGKIVLNTFFKKVHFAF